MAFSSLASKLHTASFVSSRPADFPKLSTSTVKISFRTPPPKTLHINAAGSAFGSHFCVTTFGESHGAGVGRIVDGCPPRIPVSEANLQVELDRRRPGKSPLTHPRKETDKCRMSSGVYQGETTGAPIHVFVPNIDPRTDDYNEIAVAYRPSHADATNDMKCGIRTVEGGGRSSGRETIGRVAAGAVAKKILKQFSGTEILAYVFQVHNIVLPGVRIDYESLTFDHLMPTAEHIRRCTNFLQCPVPVFSLKNCIKIGRSIDKCPDPEYADKITAAIDSVRTRGDSVGGDWFTSFDKLEAELGKAIMSIPATKGFEVGSGFAGTFLTGSEHNDEFYIDEHGKIRTRTNHSGGVQGGLSNGEIITMRVAFKPTATTAQRTVTRDKKEIVLATRGRHDPCVVPRTVPVVEAMVALVLIDQLMAHYAQCCLFPINPKLQEPLNLPSIEPVDMSI